MICKYFTICGGCSTQDIPYEEQIKQKQEKVFSLFKPLEIENMLPIVPSPDIFFYRNKMEFVTVMSPNRGENILIGQRRKNRFNHVIDVPECLLLTDKIGKIMNIVKQWAANNNISAYSLFTHEGFLRYVIVREAKNTNQIMVIIVLAASNYKYDYELKKIFIDIAEQLRNQVPEITSVYAGLNTGKADVAKSDKLYLLSGNEYIEEKLNNRVFRILPYTFFQTNTRCAEKLYSKIKELTLEKNTIETCLDVYCGTGGITLSVADCFEKIIGVESEPDSVKIAQINAKKNNIINCEFINDRAEIFLSKIQASTFGVKLSTLIVDPPRAGLAKKVLAGITELSPENIIYVSCNPESMFSDLQNLIKFYKITSLQPVDMFPHTHHIEIIAKLTHK